MMSLCDDVIVCCTVMLYCTVMSLQDILPTPGRWYDLRQREAELEERNRVLHYQQQARFQYSSDVPDVSPTHAGFVSPAHAGFVPQGEHCVVCVCV